MARNNDIQLTFKIVEHLGTIAPRNNGWDKELNLIVWNNSGPPKFDIRGWSPDHKHMTRGVTLYEDEMSNMVDLYLGWHNLEVVKRSREEKAANEKEYWDSRKARNDAMDDHTDALEAADPAPEVSTGTETVTPGPSEELTSEEAVSPPPTVEYTAVAEARDF